MTNLGSRLKRLRELRGLKQGDIAEAVGLESGAGISIIEKKGSTSPERVDALCKFFNIDKTWLLTGAGTPPEDYIEEVTIEAYNPWKDALVNKLEQENKRLWILIEKLSGAQVGNVNFNSASTNKAGATGKVVQFVPTVENKPGAQVGARA